MRPRPEVLVIGAGVSALTTAICLAEAGLGVRMRASELAHATTSYAAGAIWSPYLAEDERIEAWAVQTLPVLERLAGQPGTGVRLVHGLEAARAPVPTPGWAQHLPGFRQATELPEGFSCGWWYRAPIMDMPVYLSYLNRRTSDLKIKTEVNPVTSLSSVADQARIIVNCTGVGARHLVPDRTVRPTRGQLVVVENPDVDWFFADHDESPEPTYFLPQGGHIVLGGSAEPWRTDLAPDLDTSAAIQRRCAAIEPALAAARVLAHRVGLRPTRSPVRLERVDLNGRHIVHNYGHGGAGVTVSWACAAEVLRLIDEIGRREAQPGSVLAGRDQRAGPHLAREP